MKTQKTIRLDDVYSMTGSIIYKTERLWCDEDLTYIPICMSPDNQYIIGAEAVLVETSNINTGRSRFHLDFDHLDGIPGNSNPNICRLHGWRGTTNNIAVNAHGLRKIIKIAELKDSTVTVTVGPDLNPEAA